MFSENRRAVPWRAIGAGLLLQLALALLLIKLPFAKELFISLNDVLTSIEKATQAGTSLVFGYLGGGAAPFAVTDANANFILAFRALPIVLVMSALSALLYHWGVLQRVVRAISWLLERAMGVGGVVGLSTAANVFVGMVEAPLFVRPWLARVSRGELFAIMVGGMASIAGTVLFLYASILGKVLPDAVAHLLIASIVSAPAALVIAFLMVPPVGEATGGHLDLKSESSSSMDALTRGTLDGAQLLVNIIAMLVVFVALVTLVNLVDRALHAAGAARLGARAARLARRRALVRSAGGRQPARHQDRAERTGGLHRPRRHDRTLRAQPAADDLRAVRLRQLRQPRHHDRRHEHHVPRAARGNRFAGHEIHRRGHARDLPHRGDRGLDRLGFDDRGGDRQKLEARGH